MALLKRWVALATVAVVVVVVLIVALTGGDDGSSESTEVSASLGRELAVDADPLVVTELRIVQDRSDYGARDKCSALRVSNTSEAEWLIAGRNLNDGAGSDAYTYICMHQARVRALAKNASVESVVHNVQVFAGSGCPTMLTTLFRPRQGVSICVQTLNASTAIATGMYVSDVTATFESRYFDSISGWVTDGTSVDMHGSTTNPVFIAYKRPVRPITAIQTLSTSSISSACSEQYGADWEPAGHAAIGETIACVQRPALNLTELTTPASALGSILVGVDLVQTASACPSARNQRHALTSSWVLCASYANATATIDFIGEMRLQAQTREESPAELSAVNLRMKSIPTASGTTPVILVYRAHTGLVVVESVTAQAGQTNSSSASAPLVEDEVVAKEPLKARAGTNSTGLRLRAANSTQNSATLSFKILQLADLHFSGDPSLACRHPPQELIDAGVPCNESYTTRFVESVLDAETPDFVVFTGDNVQVPRGGDLSAAIAAVVGPVEARRIPYALVFGNHDDENGHSREAIANAVIGREYSYMQWGPMTVAGVGNYDLTVQAPVDGAWGPKGSDVFRMYFLDSHGYPNTRDFPGVKSGYDWIKRDQVEYYRELSASHHSNTSEDTAIPAVMFFHIPIPEYASVGSATYRSGEQHEAVMSPEINSNLFSALVELNEIKATFVGHDHINDYCYNRHGIQLCYGGGAGFAEAYGNASFARRARIIEWSVDNKNKRLIRSWKRHYGSSFAKRQLEEVLYKEQ